MDTMNKISGVTYTTRSADKKHEVFSSDAIATIVHCDYMVFDKTKGEPICLFYSKNCGVVISEGNCEWI